MSKNISIKEGGTGWGFTARKLETALEGGGSCLWVPEDEVKRVTKSVDENGTYEATADGAYGYSELHVNVKASGSSVTGKDPDTGEEVEVHPDPDTGEIVKTVIPSEIRIITLPTKMVYTDGETIDYTGIVVHGYSSTGQDLGAIPFEQLIFSDTTAIHDPSDAGYYVSDLIDYRVSEGDYIPTLIPLDGPYGIDYVYITGLNGYFRDRNYIYGCLVSLVQDTVTYITHEAKWDRNLNITWIEHEYSIALDESYTHDNKTVYYRYPTSVIIMSDRYFTYATDWEDIPECSHLNAGEMAWTIAYGTHVQYSKQNINVQWDRPYDGVTLTTEFTIDVFPQSQNTIGGGNT